MANMVLDMEEELIQMIHRDGQIHMQHLASERVEVMGVNVDLPICDAQRIGRAIFDARNTIGELDLGKVSRFLTIVIQKQTDVEPDELRQRILLSAKDDGAVPSVLMKKETVEFLSAVYAIPSSDTIQLGVRKCWWIPDMVAELRKSGTMRGQKKELIGIMDAVVAVGVRWLYDEEQQAKKIEMEKKAEEMRYEKAREEGALMVCECCFNEVLFDDLVQCPEGHLFCKTCVRTQIETAISEGRTNIRCLSVNGCDREVPISELERTVPESVVRRLFQIEAINAVASAQLSDTVKCHKCGFIVIFDKKEVPMTCPECNAKTCARCGEEYHPGMTCKQRKEIDKDRLVEERMNEAIVRTCPQCNAQFIKEEGCNKMECPRCHTWICYFCKQVIPRDVGYNHFWSESGVCPPEMCPLWVSNEVLHLVEREEAREHAQVDLDIKREAI